MISKTINNNILAHSTKASESLYNYKYNCIVFTFYSTEIPGCKFLK